MIVRDINLVKTFTYYRQARHQLKSGAETGPDVEQNKSQFPLLPLLLKKIHHYSWGRNKLWNKRGIRDSLFRTQSRGERELRRRART